MNNEQKYFSIGKFAATHGLKGELVLKHALGKKSPFKTLKAIFIKDKTGSLLPWFLESAKIKSDSETYLKLEGINSMEEARPLTQKEVWLADADFQLHTSKQAPISFLGSMVIDGDTPLGAIEEIIEQPHQILCRLVIQEKEVLIPLHEESLKKIDSKKKMIYVELPEGLLDIYLS